MAKFIEVTNEAYSFDDDDEIINEDEPLPMFVNIDDILWFAESRLSGIQTTTLVLKNYKTTFYVLEEPKSILDKIRRLQQCNQEMI